MSAKTYVYDAGADHKLKKPWGIDSGSVPRKFKKIWIIDSSSTPRLIFLGEDDLSMVVGTSANTNGYAQGGFGSLTPNTLGDGTIVNELIVSTHLAPTPFNLIFFIQNYPGTITSSYLTSLQIGGAIYTPADANFTGFFGGAPGGSASWQWSGAGVPTVGATVPVIVVRT